MEWIGFPAEGWSVPLAFEAADGGGMTPVLGWRDLERVKGIEPSYEAWEAAVLPLNYTRTGANCRRNVKHGLRA